MTEQFPVNADPLDGEADKLGSYYLAGIRLGIDDGSGLIAPQLGSLAKAAMLYRRSHTSRRGGRSYPVPSDSDLDPNWNVRIKPLSPEQQEINRRGAARAREELAEARDRSAALAQSATLGVDLPNMTPDQIRQQCAESWGDSVINPTTLKGASPVEPTAGYVQDELPL